MYLELVVFLAAAHRGSAGETWLARLQTHGKATTNSFLDTGHGGLPQLSELSLCVRLRVLHASQDSSLLSYFADDVDGEISLSVNMTATGASLRFSCCKGRVQSTVIPLPGFRLYVWNHLCLSLHLSSNINLRALNGQVGEWHFLEDQLGKAIQEPLVVVGGGRLVVGQDLDIPDGGFSISQSLHAEIADFLLYDVALTAPEMITFMSCQQNITHDPVIYLDGNGTVLRAVGETEVSRVSETQVCEKAEGYTLLFPERMNFYEAVIWCGTLQGSVALPRSKKENEEIHDRFQRFNDVCLDGWGTIYYLGAVGNSTTEKWSAVVDGGPLTWDNFDPGWNKPTNGYTCSSVGSHIFPYIWFSAPCNNKMCALCNFRSHPELRIRGLCTSSLFDRIFYLHDYENDRPAFDGLEQSRIYWNNDTWVMESRVHEGLRALMVAVRTQEYPLGLHTWAIHQDKCHQPQVELLLTSCGRDDYTCNSGACISKRRRCDLITDCSDLSDEFDCDVIYTPSGYSAALPPPKLSSEPLPLFFSLTITSIREFNLVEFTLVLDAIVSLRWHDSRLIFRNLQEDFRANKVKDPSRVWQPGVFIRDGTRGAVDAQPRSQALFVVLGGQTLADDDAVVAEEDSFSGRWSQLVLEKESTLTFRCQFQLRMYPVDRQRCLLVFTVHDLTNKFAVLTQDAAGVKFEGSRRLLEYELVKESLTAMVQANTSLVRVVLEFDNLFGYYICNTFVPSLMLVIICFLTLFFDLADFQDRIMVSLTAMLVLATFFSQTSLTMPKTSYMKLIDIWYLALICEDFLIIVSLVLLENLRLQQQSSLLKVQVLSLHHHHQGRRNNKQDVARFRSDDRAAELNRKLVIFFPVTLLIFLISFFVVCFCG